MNFSQWTAAFVTSVSLSVLTWGTPLNAQRPIDAEKVTIQTIPVAEDIYMLLGEGGNIGVLTGEDGVLLIDDQFAPLTEKILAAIKKISDRPVRFVFNTHWHYDHTGGNENFGKAGAVIVAHDNVRKRMSTRQFIAAFNQEIPPANPEALPVVTFNDQVTLHLNGHTVQGIHADPAHTDGDTFLYFADANVIHAGDIYFNRLYPFIDVSSGGSIDGMIAGAKQVLALADDDTKIIPGHGPLSNKAELQAYLTMLKSVRQRTQAAITAGMTVEAFVATQPMADFDKTWGQGFLSPDAFLKIVWSDLSRP